MTLKVSGGTPQPFKPGWGYSIIKSFTLKSHPSLWDNVGLNSVGAKGFVPRQAIAVVFFLATVLASGIRGETPAPNATSTAAEAKITFFVPKTRLWLGRSQIICFQLSQPATEDRYYPFEVDEKIVHLLIPPRVLKGETIGYLRVQPLAEGKTRIGVADAKIDVEIMRDPAAHNVAELSPQIVSPASGAYVWGQFAVGVEQMTLGDPTTLPAPTLLLPNGKEITGHAVPDQKPSPHARWTYTVNADDLGPGSNSIVAMVQDDSGHVVTSDPLDVVTVKPDASALVAGSCQQADAHDRPANAGGNGPAPVNDDKYNQGTVLNETDGGSWCLPVWVPKQGRYQMMITARGDMAGDALPTLGVTQDEEGQARTTTRLATTEWQRIPVGRPLPLSPGGHMLTLRFGNGMSRGPDDTRTLFLQKFELARVDQPAANVASNGGGMMAMSMMSGGSGEGDLQVNFTNYFDRQMDTGAIDVYGQCWYRQEDHPVPPKVDLFVNKRPVASQRGMNVHFHVDPAAFVAGSNLVELHAAFPGGKPTSSVPFTVEVPPDFPMPTHPFRPEVTYTTFDSGLCSTMDPPLKQSGDPAIAEFYSNAKSTIKLPDDLTGRYWVAIDARGDDYQGPPLMKVGLVVGGQESKIAEKPVGPNMGAVQIGEINLAPGEKSLTVAFTNDKYDKDKGDRNLYVKAVRLFPNGDSADKSAPRVSIAYAPKESTAKSVDAVVARAMDDTRVDSVDLLIDGQPQHLDQRPVNGLGPVVLPVVTRDLAPGIHKLQVIAKDDAGNQGMSEEASFDVSATVSNSPTRYERALFLLNRFGYGPEPAEIASILAMGEKPWLDSQLATLGASPSEKNETQWMNAQFSNRRDQNVVARGAVAYLLTEPNAVRARFVMWAENHFSTWINKDGSSAKAVEHQRFVKLGPAPFFDLLLTSATSPAMLYYLDQRNSVARHINENYAREIMELHTLGVKGGYTQKDVTTLANLLTGWTLNDEAPSDGSGGDLDRFFGFDPRLSSGQACRVLGLEFPGTEPEKRFDRVLMALEMLTAHPSCATFISRRLCEEYVSDPAPPKLVAAMSQTYLETGGDISAMMETMSQHPDFWAAQDKVTTPIDFGVRIARMAHSQNSGAVSDLISASGMGMFDRATPDGYPEDDGFSMNSNAILQRWRFARQMQGDLLGAGLVPNALKPADNAWNPDVTQRIVDIAAVHLTGNLLGDASNDAAQKLLDGAPPNTDVRLHALATLICQLPENSLK